MITEITVKQVDRKAAGSCNLCPYNDQPKLIWAIEFRAISTSGNSSGQQVRLCDEHLAILREAISTRRLKNV